MAEPMNDAEYELRSAEPEDLDEVFEFLRPLFMQRQLMRRTRAETGALLRTGFVVVLADKIIGFSAVEIYSKKLAEIQCLAVASEHRRQGLGRQLVRACVELARSQGVMEVMAISASEKFLFELGFDYSLPDQKRALFCQLRSREEVYRELDE